MNRGKRKTFVTVTLIVLSVIAALIVEVVGGAAGGASVPKSSAPKSPAHAVAAPPGSANPGPGTGGAAITYRTVGTNVNLRAGASTGSAIITTMIAVGSPVVLSCYLRGTSIAGDPWWYRAAFISAHGYVSGFWVDTGPDPAKTHLPAC